MFPWKQNTKKWWVTQDMLIGHCLMYGAVQGAEVLKLSVVWEKHNSAIL